MKSDKHNRSQLLQMVLAAGLIMAASGCGSGGNEPVAAASTGDAAVIAAPPVPAADGVPTPVTGAPPSNSVPVTVNAGIADTINVGFTSVTLCTPGNSTQCQTVDNIIVDTGSTGFRVFGSALSSALALPAQADGSGMVLAECMQFVDSSVWGTIRIADLRIGGEQAAALPIQILSDHASPAVPDECENTGRLSTTEQAFGAKGILGVGVFLQDCGSRCETNPANGVYYRCSANACTAASAPVAQQVQHPVAFFASNNNGVMLAMPPVSGSAGAVSGELIFGIGTQSNNTLGSATPLAVNPMGMFTTVYKGGTYAQGFIDSGSNAIFFHDPEIPACPLGFYCPPAPLQQSAINVDGRGAAASATFGIVDAAAAISANPDHFAFGQLAGPVSSTNVFVWGMPFFYGRRVFTAIEGKTAGGPVGPYFAY